jgi:phage terminase small subunit
MARGRKPKLVDNTVHSLPLHDEPRAVHYARAKELKPDWLKPDQAELWDLYGPHLAMLDRLKPHFVPAFTEFCIVSAKLRAARQKLDDEEWTYVTETRNGTQHKSRPEVSQLNDDWRKWRSLVGEFGLAPQSEKGLINKDPVFNDGFDDF